MSGDTREMAVVVQDLVKCFGNFTAVDHISFTVPKGEIFGFLGPNGAGKSTTIRMLCGILLPTSGSGTVAGFDILRQPEQIKAHIGYMSQRFSLYQDLTVDENINFYAGIYGVPREAAGGAPALDAADGRPDRTATQPDPRAVHRAEAAPGLRHRADPCAGDIIPR